MENKIKDIICEQLGIEQDAYLLTAKLKGELGADDYDMVEIAMALEDEFAISIEDDLRFHTPQEIITYIKEKKQV